MATAGTLTRADLAESLHREVGLSRADAARLVEQVLGHMCEALAQGQNVKISGFGSFILRDKGERVGRNPKTGVEVPIAPRRVLTFRASQMMRDRIVSAGALWTIGELAEDIGRPQHILRYWETRFPQLRPLTRAGNRRYYRPDDVALVRRIHSLLTEQGYTIRGVQKLLAAERLGRAKPPGVASASELKRVRDTLADALEKDEG